MSELYAKLFVDTSADHAALLRVVRDCTNGVQDDWTIVSSSVEAEVRPNDDSRLPARDDSPDDFVYFPFTIDIEPVNAGCGLDEFLKGISTIVVGLAQSGMRVVAACDWEDALPGGGRLGFN